MDGEAEAEVLHKQPQDEMEGALLLDVIIRQSSSVLQLLPGEDEPLLVGRNPLLVLKE